MVITGSASRANRGITMSGSSTDDNLPVKSKRRIVKTPGIPPVAAAAAPPLPTSAGRGGGGGGGGGADSEGSDSENAERGSEVCQIGADVCVVPAQLFDLPNLMAVLSLNTWNYCLTEEDRESLMQFLPPFEEEDPFKDTMRDLLGGENFHFGSPIMTLFDRLKKGLCHPRVLQYREGLKYLQRKEHYHLIRQYHNQMVNLFLEMQQTWQSCPEADFEERLQIWHKPQSQPQLPPLPVKSKRVMRKPVLTRNAVKAAALDGAKKRLIEGMKTKVLELPTRGKFLQEKKLPVATAPVLPAKKKMAMLIPKRVGFKGVLKIKTGPRGAAEGPSKRIPEKENNADKVRKPRLNKTGPKGVLKVISKGQGVMKQIDTLLSKGKGPSVDVKCEMPENLDDEAFYSIDELEHRNEGGYKHKQNTEEMDKDKDLYEIEKEDVGEVGEYAEERVQAIPSKGEISYSLVVAPSVPLKSSTSEGSEKKPKKEPSLVVAPLVPLKYSISEGSEKKPRKQPVGERKKRKMLDVGGVVSEAEKTAKKKKQMKELIIDDIASPGEMLEMPEKANEGVHDVLKKTHRKKKVEAKTKKPDEMEVVENKAAEDEGRIIEELEDRVVEVPSEENLGGDWKDDGDKAPSRKQVKKKVKTDKITVHSSPADSPPHTGLPGEKGAGSSGKCAKKLVLLAIPTLASTFSFSVTHLLSAVRAALLVSYGEDPSEYRSDLPQESFGLDLPYGMSLEGSLLGQSEQSPAGMGDETADGKETDMEPKSKLTFSVPFAEVVRRVQANPGDIHILETVEPLQDLVRGALKIMASKVAPLGAKGWKPLVLFDKEARAWTWIGPLPPVTSSSSQGIPEVQIMPEAWGIPQKTLTKLEEMFASWLKHDQETLQQIVQLPLPPPPPMPGPVDERDRFRDLRAQKSLMTITPSTEDMRAYFRREELVRYSLPDRVFRYTTADGGKSAVAPLRRGGGKPTSKARDHVMLKPDRPPHVTILCLVRDAAARLPGSIGTRADVCVLIRDSDFIMEDVSDAQVNQAVSGALDRLHYERDPCVRFDGDRKLWVYLHTDRSEEDFEDDGTSSTKRWKKPKKENAENSEHSATAYETGSPSGPDQDGTMGAGMGMDMQRSPDEIMGGPGDHHSAIYSVAQTELVYNRSSSLTSPRVLSSGTLRDDGAVPFIELSPGIDRGHPMGWEGVGSQHISSWAQHSHLHSQESIGIEDDEYDFHYGGIMEAAAAAAQQEADAMISVDTEQSPLH